jgi:hypothetical protein
MKFERFFFPSSEITRQLTTRIGHTRAANLRSAIAETLEEPESGLVESDQLLTSVLAALEDNSQRTAEGDWKDRRWLSEIIYHFMGRLARQSYREKGKKFSLTECLVEGMRSRLGLREPADTELLLKLANEFSSWLQREDGIYIAGWGKIVGSSENPDKLSFKPLEIGTTATAAGVGQLGERQTAEVATGRSLEADLDIAER